MKYMILTFGVTGGLRRNGRKGVSQAGLDRRGLRSYWSVHAAFNQELVESGELVETRGLSAPVHARRTRLRDGVPVVTDGPYAEAEEVLRRIQ